MKICYRAAAATDTLSFAVPVVSITGDNPVVNENPRDQQFVIGNIICSAEDDAPLSPSSYTLTLTKSVQPIKTMHYPILIYIRPI